MTKNLWEEGPAGWLDYHPRSQAYSNPQPHHRIAEFQICHYALCLILHD